MASANVFSLFYVIPGHVLNTKSFKEDTIFAMTNGPNDGRRDLQAKHGVGKQKGATHFP